MKRRILSLLLPYFPTERHAIEQSRRTSANSLPWWDSEAERNEVDQAKGPLVLVREGAKGVRLFALTPQAEALGLRCDMKLSDARAMIPALQVHAANEVGDANALHRLAGWMQRYSPSVMIYDACTLLLDTHGCDHLFGGEEAMGEDIHMRLARMGLSAELAFAKTPGSALALANYGDGDLIVHPRNALSDALDHLPIEALRLEVDTLVLLRRLGLKRVGDVRLIPRSALERRFGQFRLSKQEKLRASQSLQRRLDQLSGHLNEPLTTLAEPPDCMARLPSLEPAQEQAAVETALAHLLDQVCVTLERQGRGARLFRLVAFRVDGGWSDVHIALSYPGRDTDMIKRLFRDRLEAIDCGFGIDLFTLEALRAEPLLPGQVGLMGDKAQQGAELASFADTLANRAGHSVASRFAPCESHVPERAQNPVSITQDVDWAAYQSKAPVKAPRPTRLLARPEPAQVIAMMPDAPPAQFVWRRRVHRIIRARGPERILPEWWLDDFRSKKGAQCRDYYDVEDEEGGRYWLFRALYERAVLANAVIAKGHADEEEWNHAGCGQTPRLTGTDPVQQEEPETERTMEWFVHGLF